MTKKYCWKLKQEKNTRKNPWKLTQNSSLTNFRNNCSNKIWIKEIVKVNLEMIELLHKGSPDKFS